MNIRKIFQTRVRHGRYACGLTQTELAKLAGLQPSAIAHFEAGRRTPNIENLFKLSKALMVRSDYLIGRSSF